MCTLAFGYNVCQRNGWSRAYLRCSECGVKRRLKIKEARERTGVEAERITASPMDLGLISISLVGVSLLDFAQKNDSTIALTNVIPCSMDVFLARNSERDGDRFLCETCSSMRCYWRRYHALMDLTGHEHRDDRRTAHLVA